MLRQQPLPDFVLKAPLHHSITLPDGRVIKGGKSLAIMQDQYERTFEPLSLHGKSVVDLGTWTGAFAVEAARRGASKVVGVDHFMWKHDPNVRQTYKFIMELPSATIFQTSSVTSTRRLWIRPVSESLIFRFSLASSTILKILSQRLGKSPKSRGRSWSWRPIGRRTFRRIAP